MSPLVSSIPTRCAKECSRSRVPETVSLRCRIVADSSRFPRGFGAALHESDLEGVALPMHGPDTLGRCPASRHRSPDYRPDEGFVAVAGQREPA